jgi:hypothetical protein
MLKAISTAIDMDAMSIAMEAESQSWAAMIEADALSTAFGGGPNTAAYVAYTNNWIDTRIAAKQFNVGDPVPRTLSLNTAYQATDPTKAANVKIVLSTTTTIGVGSPQDNTFAVYVGTTNAVAGGTGTIGDTGGLALNVTLISLGLTQTQSATVMLGIGRYFAIRRLTGTQTVIASAYDQSLST